MLFQQFQVTCSNSSGDVLRHCPKTDHLAFVLLKLLIDNCFEVGHKLFTSFLYREQRNFVKHLRRGLEIVIVVGSINKAYLGKRFQHTSPTHATLLLLHFYLNMTPVTVKFAYSTHLSYIMKNDPACTRCQRQGYNITQRKCKFNQACNQEQVYVYNC